MNIVKGEASVWLIYDPTTDGIFGPVSMGGKAFVGVYVPEFIPLVGGYEIYSVGAEVSTYRLFLGVSIIGIPISVGYYWDDGKVIFGDSFNAKSRISNDASALIPRADFENALKVEYMDKQENDGSAIVYGGNLRTTYDSKSMLRQRNYNPKSHSINISEGQDYGLFELLSIGEDLNPTITVTDPKGETYELVEDVNYIKQMIPRTDTQSGDDEFYYYISLIEPMAGNWKINTSEELSVKGMDVLALPEVDNVTVDYDKEESSITATWDENNVPANYNANLYLTQSKEVIQPSIEMNTKLSKQQSEDMNLDMANNYDAGILLAKDIPVNKGEHEMELPEELLKRLQDGSYHLRVVIEGEDNCTYASSISEDKFAYTSPFTPEKPQNFKAELGGDSLFEISYDPQANIDGFMVQVLNEVGEVISDISPIKLDSNSDNAYVGGMYYKTIEADADGNPITQELAGVLPNETYRIALSTYCVVDGNYYQSDTIMSEPMFLPEPKSASISVKVDGKNSSTPQSIGQNWVESRNESLQSVLVNEINPELIIQSDQAGELMVSVNNVIQEDTFQTYTENETIRVHLTLFEGENIVKVFTKNTQQDYTNVNLSITVDATEPELMLNNIAMTGKNGEFTVVGTVESNAAVYIDDSKTPLDQLNGIFNYYGKIKGARQTVEIRAVDIAGNEKIMSVDVIPDEISAFVNMSLGYRKVSDQESEFLPLEDLIKLEYGENYEFIAYGISEDGKQFVIENSYLKWSIMAGNGVVGLNDAGELIANTPGNAVVGCEYFVTDDYSFDQSIELVVNNPTGLPQDMPSEIRISNTNLSKDISAGDEILFFSIPKQPMNVIYSFKIEGTDAEYFEVVGNKLIAKVDLSDRNYTISLIATPEKITEVMELKDESDKLAPIVQEITLSRLYNIVSAQTFPMVTQYTGVEFYSIDLPIVSEVILDNDSEVEYAIIWEKGAYKKDIAGIYTLHGEIQAPDNITNYEDITATMQVMVNNRPDNEQSETDAEAFWKEALLQIKNSDSEDHFRLNLGYVFIVPSEVLDAWTNKDLTISFTWANGGKISINGLDIKGLDKDTDYDIRDLADLFGIKYYSNDVETDLDITVGPENEIAPPTVAPDVEKDQVVTDDKQEDESSQNTLTLILISIVLLCGIIGAVMYRKRIDEK